MNCPPLSVIIPWCNRPEIQDTIAKNKAIFEDCDCEVIIVNAGGDLRMLKGIEASHIRVVDARTRNFNRSRAVNIGAHIALSDFLFLLDADMLLNEGYLKNALTVLTGKSAVVVEHILETDSRYQQVPSSEYISDIMYYVTVKDKFGATATVRMERQPVHFYSRVGNSQVLISKHDFLNVNGLNSNLKGWGFEDNDFLIRLQLKLGLSILPYGSIFHLTHNNLMRDAEPGKTIEEHEKINSMMSLNAYLAGNYDGTFDQDVQIFSSTD